MKLYRDILIGVAIWCGLLIFLYLDPTGWYENDPVSPEFIMYCLATVAILLVGGAYFIKHQYLIRGQRVLPQEPKTKRNYSPEIIRLLAIPIAIAIHTPSKDSLMKDGVIILALGTFIFLIAGLLKSKRKPNRIHSTTNSIGSE